MFITEKIKGFLKTSDNVKSSSEVKPENIIADIDNDSLKMYGSNYDNGIGYSTFNFGIRSAEELVQEQAQLIQTYRSISSDIEVSRAIDEIVNEIVFCPSAADVVRLDISDAVDMNAKVKQAITDAFNKIMSLLNTSYGLYEIVKKSFIDGQAVLWCEYDLNNPKLGIQQVQMIEPTFLFWDDDENVYHYDKKYCPASTRVNFAPSDEKEKYSLEEIVKVDFGLHRDGLVHSYIENAIKPANQLKQLEDMLVLLRFSRSISRRVFNVDIGDLPTKRGQEYMQSLINKFKYNKFYDAKTGEITKQGRTVSMVEDYWFANRSGGKGTSVDVLDETGNLNEMNDLYYFLSKIYRALYVPTNRIYNDPNSDKSWDYESTALSKEDIGFFAFVSRLRKVYAHMFKELLRRELVSTNVVKDEEWKTINSGIKIIFGNENNFIEKMNADRFSEKMDIYNNISDQLGKSFSVQTVFSKVFNMSAQDVEAEQERISKERANKKYENFYTSDTTDDF